MTQEFFWVYPNRYVTALADGEVKRTKMFTAESRHWEETWRATLFEGAAAKSSLERNGGSKSTLQLQIAAYREKKC